MIPIPHGGFSGSAPSDTEFRVALHEKVRGAWLETPGGLMCLVAQAPDQPQYIGVYPGDPKKPEGLPYSMSFDPVGKLMLQIPGENGEVPILVPMDEVVELLKARQQIDTKETELTTKTA